MKLPSLLLKLATIATLTLVAGHRLYGSNPEIFITGDASQGGGIVGAYTLAGGTLNATLVSGLGFPVAAVVSGGDLFVVDNENGTVGEYDATTGATINASLISGLADPKGIAISGSMLFVTVNNDMAFTAQVAEYTTGGVLVNGALITGLRLAVGIAVSGSDLYVADFASGTVGQYTTSGTPINPSLITPSGRAYNLAVSGTSLFVISPEEATVYNYTTSGDFVTSWQITDSIEPGSIAVSGSDVFVGDFSNKTVREYTTTGAIVNNALISGVSDLVGMTISAVGAPTPTPTPTPSATATPTPPPHGGLSTTVFYVNGSKSPQSGLADTILNFTVLQTGTPAGLYVRVQYSISGGTWTDLSDGNAGHMTYDPTLKEFITSSGNYPPMSAVSFRAISAAQGYPDSISNVVGSFNLASSKPRLSPPALAVTGNGPFADLYFRSYVAKPTTGMALRVQSTTTPLNQTSWTDLDDGGTGHMTLSNDPTRFYLMDNKLPAGTGVYFRTIASLTGYEDALSTPVGPFNITPDTPPNVIITAPKAQSGSGTLASPYVYAFGSLQFSATATPGPGRKVEGVGLTADGELFAVSLTNTVSASYSPLAVGDHLIEALAADDLAAINRFTSNPVYIRVIPSTSSQAKAETANGGQSQSDATVSGRTFTVAKSGGNWNDPTTWKDSLGKTGVPGQSDLAIVGSSTVNCPLDVVAGSVTLNGGTIMGPGTLDVFGIITISSGTFVNSILDIFPGGVCELTNSATVQFGGTVDNQGTWNVHGGGPILGLDNFENSGTTNFQAPVNLPPLAGMDPSLDTRAIAASSTTNSGLLSSALVSTLLASPGSNLLSEGGAHVVSNDGGSIISQDGSNVINHDGGSLITQDGGSLQPQLGGAVVSHDGGTDARQVVRSAQTPTGFVQTAGETNLDGLLIGENVTLNGGVLDGSGIIAGDLTNNSGYISPGHSMGVIGVSGSFTQTASGTLVIEDSGGTPADFNQLQVAGAATIGGTLDIQLTNGYNPGSLDTFSPLGYSSVSGQFSAVSSNATVTVTDSGLNASVNPAVAGPSAAASRNISTRALVQTRQNVVIGGFIVTGPAGSTKQVIIRGIGPSLTAAGVQGALGDPFLQLYSGSALLSSNDNWKENEAAVEATGFAPTNDLESAIVATLAPGSYTAVLSGTSDATGVGLVEVYDLAPASAALLANISTRCSVQVGDQVLIGGFILQGPEPAKVLVRALGPSLAAGGITGALQDPVLDLHDANGEVIENDDWLNTQETEIIATGIPPSDPRESAILATLPPGAYTAIVSGKDGGTGVSLVEVYNIQ